MIYFYKFLQVESVKSSSIKTIFDVALGKPQKKSSSTSGRAIKALPSAPSRA